jgi:TRAP-type mannitol/chloroaromatic compound transport system permease small subunit
MQGAVSAAVPPARTGGSAADPSEAVGLERYLFRIDRLSAWIGKTFAWVIVILAVFMTYDITCRYFSKTPVVGEFIRDYLWVTRSWAYDVAYELYGTLFMMGGAYTLSRAAHVRGDIFYRMWPVRVQGAVDLFLFIVAFFPGVIALVFVGVQWGQLSYSFLERSPTQPQGPPIWPFKFVIPVAAFFLAIQGVAETIRCLQALRTGVWPRRLSDVEETETILARQSEL